MRSSSLTVVLGWLLSWTFPGAPYSAWSTGTRHPESEKTKVRSLLGRLGNCCQHICSEKSPEHVQSMAFHTMLEHTHTHTHTLSLSLSHTLTHIHIYNKIGYLGPSWRRLSLCLPSWLDFFMLSSSLLFPGLLGVSTTLLHLWPWICLLFVSALTLLWLLLLPRVAAVLLHHQRSLWESTCSRCWSHLSPNFGIRGCFSSAPIHLLVVSAHLLFLANWMVTAWPPLHSPLLAY